MRDALERFAPRGRVLELACGTGIWTQQLAAHAESVTALDASPEALAICRARVSEPNVSYVKADLFEWEPRERYDVCFFGFWLSHVPRERWQAFWNMVASALSPGGRVFFVDSARSDLASAADHLLPELGEQTMLRRLSDGREYTIVKHWFEPDALRECLSLTGWDVEVRATPTFFVYGQGQPTAR